MSLSLYIPLCEEKYPLELRETWHASEGAVEALKAFGHHQVTTYNRWTLCLSVDQLAQMVGLEYRRGNPSSFGHLKLTSERATMS